MSTIVEAYIDYLYQELGEEEAREVLSIPPGVKILRNRSQNLFEHRHVKLWHRFLIKYFNPSMSGKRYSLIMPCSSIKPYSASPTHQIADAVLRKNNVLNYVQIYILSEPMILVPKELDIYYPFANYDYPPHELTPRFRQVFIELLSHVLPKLEYHRKIVAVLPKHHKVVLQESLKKSSANLDIVFMEYGRKAFHSVKIATETIVRYVVKEF